MLCLKSGNNHSHNGNGHVNIYWVPCYILFLIYDIHISFKDIHKTFLDINKSFLDI